MWLTHEDLSSYFYCELDSFPKWMLKCCLTELLPLLTTLVNKSWTTGSFHVDFKLALIKPHLKKQILDLDLLKNYRPVYNLHFLSKIIETVVIQRLEVHITINYLQDSVQSEYRKQHSTETALLKIHNVIVTSLDLKKYTLLASVDLSAEFHTIDHSILIHRFQCEYGSGGVLLQYFKSYLLNRNQIVSVKGRNSNVHHLQWGFHKDLFSWR